MSRRSSETSRRSSATWALATILLLWIGALAPLERMACAHAAPGHGMVHASALCVWSCAASQPGIVHAVRSLTERLPENGSVDGFAAGERSQECFGAALSRGPPCSEHG